jgi:hypothetical protein
VFSTSTVLPLNKANEVLSYYIYTILDQISITNSNTQLLINVVLQIVNIIVAVGMCFFVDRLGRRLLFPVATAGMLVSFVVWTICSARSAISGSKAAADLVVLMIFVFYVFYNTAWSGLLVGYTIKILPYNIRAKVQARCLL